MSSKRYPEEFKIETVKQITERRHPVAEVASRIGVSQHSLYAWLNATVCQGVKTATSGVRQKKFVV
ncbi:transposase [Nitrosospira multiformis]|uniref:Transposase n=1 Tax=Nitrosospira multiformis TaxID=1231 RepID=A0A1H8NMK0_9PROT|nr:transposase [Nitrosospira multiformis]